MKVNFGITPAHAGKTLCNGCRFNPRKDHPRACGENIFDSVFAVRLAGSPPRMRGKLSTSAKICPTDGITPAHAGKTTRYLLQRVCHEDHPRACGENLLTYGYNSSNMGSPPRMRGKRQILTGKTPDKRITPAHAGKTYP